MSTGWLNASTQSRTQMPKEFIESENVSKLFLKSNSDYLLMLNSHIPPTLPSEYGGIGTRC